MNIGIFTDTYFPQVSGVATSIKTLKTDLERKGHSVYIFTTTDPKVPEGTEEPNIFRFTSVPFVSFTDRRIAVRGLFHALQVAKKLRLDIVHTQTEFALGYIGKFVARNLKIPVVHTYHTMYEDYLHYVMNGHLLRPYHVKQISRAFLHNDSGVVAPSARVQTTLEGYGISAPIRIIPTGVDMLQYDHAPSRDIRSELGLNDVPVLVSVSRVAYEKRIDRVIDAMPRILRQHPDTVLLVVGDGPARESLEEQAETLELGDSVRFLGEVNHDEVADYYHAGDIFVSASDSEAQGLTYIEAMASGVKVLALRGDYTNALLDDPTIGRTFKNPSEMAAQVVDYLDYPEQYSNDDARSAKLQSVSADEFGNRILQFYQDATVYYQTAIAGRENRGPIRLHRVRRRNSIND